MATTDLEALWAGPFGDAYTERNRHVGADRGEFWRGLQTGLMVRSCLEVGCNVGANLRWFLPGTAFGVDLNRTALADAERVVPGCVAAASADALPFGPKSFELVFTCGLLIHIRRDRLKRAMREIARVARDRVLLMEYDAPEEEVVEWRGQPAALWRAPYGRLFQMYAPGFRVRATSVLIPRKGFDNVTYWLFEREGVGG